VGHPGFDVFHNEMVREVPNYAAQYSADHPEPRPEPATESVSRAEKKSGAMPETSAGEPSGGKNKPGVP